MKTEAKREEREKQLLWRLVGHWKDLTFTSVG
jgi:hypothetical protein